MADLSTVKIPDASELRFASHKLRRDGVRFETQTPNAFGQGSAYREQLDRVADFLDVLAPPVETEPACQVCGHVTVSNCKTVEDISNCRFVTITPIS